MEDQGLQDASVILVIEDDPILSKMYTEKFTKEGFKVITALDGETGLDMALSNKVDMILLDVMLPRMSGIDLLKKLRDQEKGNKTLVVVLTNLADAEEKKRAMELGAKDYLVKAMQNPGQVVEKVKEHLNG